MLPRIGMPSWCQEYSSGCWISDSRYEGPISTKNDRDHEFMIHATLELGAERYFSGFRVLVGCNDTQENLAALEIGDNVELNTLHAGKPDVQLERLKRSQLEAQENGCKLAKKWAEGDPCATAPLPLCTLVVEILDITHNGWHQVTLAAHSPSDTESQPLRTLYDYVELYTPISRSCVLFLRTNRPFRRIFHKDNLFPMIETYKVPGSVPTGILVLGVRILPPPASRGPFIQLPEELRRMIFKEAKIANQSNWRKTMLSLALVCRAWGSALDNLYEDFGRDSLICPVRPNALQLAKTLELNPPLGKKIKVLNAAYFRRPQKWSDAPYLERAKAIVTILQTATGITHLSVSETHQLLAQDFVRALCSSSDVRDIDVTRGGMSLLGAQFVYVPNLGDIAQCLSHWPRARRLKIIGIPSSLGLDDLPVPACSIESVLLDAVTLDLSHLRLLTTSWRSSLRNATIGNISGLTNEDIRIWLSEVGPTLEYLNISTPLSRRSNDEEYAVDAMLPIMSNLAFLDLNGDIASHLVLQRFAPTTESLRGHRYRLWMENAPGVNGHGFLNALTTTAWTAVFLDLLWEDAELREEAQRIAKQRNINLISSFKTVVL